MRITDLPPFNPRLDEYRAEEFLAHSLLLLEYPIEQDQKALDLAPFQLKPPPPPPDPLIPLLPHIWYPKPTQGVLQVAPTLVQAPRPLLFVGTGAQEAAEKVMRPVLAGQGFMMIHGEAGLGKTTLLHYIATHERTRQRFRRIWYFDEPERVGQLCAILLNLPTVLAEADPYHQLTLLGQELRDDTLLVIDNLTLDHPLYVSFQTLSRFVILGVETPPEIFEEDEEGRKIIPPDPPNTVILRRWQADDAVNLLAQTADLIDRKGIGRDIRPPLEELAVIVDFHPLGLTILGSMLAEDDLTPFQLLDYVRKLVASTDVHLGVEVALRACIETLPIDYKKLLEGFIPFSLLGIPADALQHITEAKNELAFTRGLTILKRRNLLHTDDRFQEYYLLPKPVFRHLATGNPHEAGKTLGERARKWLIRLVDEAVYEPERLFLAEQQIRFAYQLIRQEKILDFAARLNRTLSDYLRVYIPALLPHDAPPPRLIGERAEAIRLARQGLEQAEAESGDLNQARSMLQQALDQLKVHGSSHDVAEVLVMLARLEHSQREYAKAVPFLESAAKLVYDLNAQESISAARLGLAMLYRHLGRYKDALGVLDDRPEANAERARVYRAMGNIDAMINILGAGDLSPYARAESYLQGERYAEALEAIANDATPPSYHLRGLIFHLQGDYETALRGYQRALQVYPPENPHRAIPARAIACVHTLTSDYESAEAILLQTLEELKSLGEPQQIGLTQGLLAAVHLQQGNNRTAAETATQALQKLAGSNLHDEMGTIYQVLARANWRLERYEAALRAFLHETEHVQSELHRNQTRIAIAFFHSAEGYRALNQLERAVANHRLALSQVNADEAPLVYLMIQSALHRVLTELDRHAEALELNQAIIAHLDRRPPPDLGHLGYWLCVEVRAYERTQQLKLAYKPFSRWLNTLAGRADALTDENRPALAVLVLSLATRSLLAGERVTNALPLAAEALRLADEYLTRPDWQKVRWSARRDYGEALVATEQWQLAYQTFLPILKEEVKAHIETHAAVYEGAAYALYKQGEYRAALELYWVALESQPIPHKQGLLFERIAETYLALNEINNAVQNLNEALKFLDRKQYPHITARVLTTLAHTLAGANHYADAIGVYQEALRMLTALPDVSPLHTARVYDSLGRSHERQGQFHEAAQAYRQALDIIEQNHLSAPDDYRQTLLRLARVMVIRNDHLTAIPYFEKARDEALNWGTHQEVGNITRELAEAERESGQLARSLKSYEDGLVFLTRDFPSDRAAVLRNYGQALAQSQQFTEARKAWNEALEITQDMSPLEIALTHHAIGQAFRAQMDYSGAEQAFREALPHHPKGTVHLAATYRELGEVLFEAIQFDEALAALQAALEIEKTLPQQSNARLVKVLHLLGLTEERRENAPAAIAHYHAALVYMDRQFQPVFYAATLRTLGILYASLKKWEECQKAWGECLELELSLKPREEERIAQTLRMIGNAYIEEGHLEKAATAFKRMASYANLSQEDAQKLRSTLNDIDRYKATLTTALDSLSVLEKSGGEVKAFVYVYALVVRMYYLLSELESSRAMMAKLVRYLNSHADELSIEDERPDYRSLAYFRLAMQYDNQADRSNARDHYRKALKDSTDSAMTWLIEQSMSSVD